MAEVGQEEEEERDGTLISVILLQGHEKDSQGEGGGREIADHIFPRERETHPYT